MTISECRDSVETLLVSAIPKDVRSLHYYDLIVLVYEIYRKWQNVCLSYAELPVLDIYGFYLLSVHISNFISTIITCYFKGFFPFRRLREL